MTYDLTARNILCHADKDGAQVHIIAVGTALYRVLAHSRDDAREAAQEHHNAKENAHEPT